MIIAITGPDGSGKSTVCRGLFENLESKLGVGNVVRVSVWDSSEQSGIFSSGENILNYLNDLNGSTRTLFIYHALSRSIDLSQRKKPKVTIIDGHWYKYAATELGYGVSPSLVLGAASEFVKPDLTFYLDVDAETAFQRKKMKPSHYEQGGHSSTSSFILFQQKLTDIWQNLESQYGPWIHLTSQGQPQEISQKIFSEVIRKL